MVQKKNSSTTNRTIEHNPKRRPGVVAKTKTSSNKSSKNYVKPYRGQGR